MFQHAPRWAEGDERPWPSLPPDPEPDPDSWVVIVELVARPAAVVGGGAR